MVEPRTGGWRVYRTIKRRRWLTVLAVIALVVGACSNGAPDPVAEQAQTVIADESVPPGEAASATSGDVALRVTVAGQDLEGSDESITTTTAASTTTSLSTLVTTSTTMATAISSTTTSNATSSTATSTVPSTESQPTSSSSTTDTGSTSSTSSTTAPSTVPAVNFPDLAVTSHPGGQVVSLSDQVAGSRPVLVWFWLPG